jgi:thiol:disulfide interchange protein DsbC
MKPISLIAATILAAAASLPVFSQDADAVKAALRKKFPDAPIDAVRKIPYGNLYEVVGNGEIFYTDDKTTYLLVGTLVDVKTKENVTEVRQRTLNAVKFDTLPFDQAIKIVRGNGARKVAILEDPNCGYCKRFERDLQGISDITVYVFLYPILSPDSIEKSKAIWCSADPGKVWLDHMTKNASIAGEGKCNTAAIDKSLAFGKEKRVSGTPTIFFEDGERVPGAMPIAQFEKKIGGQKQAAVSSVPASSAPAAPISR